MVGYFDATSAAVGAWKRVKGGTGFLKNMAELQPEACGQATRVVTCPGNVIEITPPQLHTHLEVLLRAGM